MRIPVLLIAVLGCGTGPDGQPFRDGVQAMCDLPDHVPPGESYEKRLAAAGAWADAHITNPDARSLGGVTTMAANRQVLTDAVHKAGITRCKLLDNGMALQSFGDAMTVLCTASAPPEPGYVRAQLLNPEVIQLLAALGDLAPADRIRKLRDAVARAGIASCPFLGVSSKVTVKYAPQVQGAGFVEIEPDRPLLVATPSVIVLDGKSIVAVVNGEIDPAEIQGGATGVLIPRLRAFVAALATNRGGPMRLQLAIDPALTYKFLIGVLFTTRAAGVTDCALVVRVGDDAKAIPVRLREPPAASVHGNGKGLAGLGLIVSIDGDKLLLWSSSGAEGTEHKPKRTVHHADELANALAEIVDRRWQGAARSDLDRRIVVLARGAESMQRVAEVLAVVRARPDGRELFPDILLSSGFE